MENTCSFCLENIALAEELKLNCGHRFHGRCFRKNFLLSPISLGKKISFFGKRCPLCSVIVTSVAATTECKENETLCAEIKKEIEDVQKVLEEIKKDAEYNVIKKFSSDLKALKGDGSEIVKQEYVLAQAEYYNCFKCKHPYFGGFKERCFSGEEEEKMLAAIPAESLICNQCINSGRDSCPKHGDLGMVYKCRFCCNYAIWICSGVHYCEPCHNGTGIGKAFCCQHKQSGFDPEKCKHRLIHNGPGSEHSFGCGICLHNEALST